MIEQNLTANDAEQLVRERLQRSNGAKTRGAPLRTNLRFTTSSAIVRVSFRKQHVSGNEVLQALREAGDQVREEHGPATA